MIICLFGASGTGKSYYRQKFIDEGCRSIKSHTTRPKRFVEENEYHFVPTLSAWNIIEKELINKNHYQGYYYGASLKDVPQNETSIMITDISSIENLREEIKATGHEMAMVYIEPPSKKELHRRHTIRRTPERIEIALSEIKEYEKIIESFRHKRGFFSIKENGDVERILNLLQPER